MSASVETRRIPTTRGHRLAATLHRAPGEAGAAVLIAPAMGVQQRYYAPLAGWLAARGYHVATFDYAGIGQSREGRLRDVDVDIFDWARHDCEAMLHATAALAPGKPLYWIGHSLGGQVLGLVPGRERVAKAVTVAAGSGYWRENVPALRRRVWWLWYVLVPLATRAFGYFPGERLRKVGDLPRGVIQQWRRWCLHPEYVVGVEGEAIRAQYAALRVPMTSLSFTDDELMSARNIDSLHGFYAGAPKVMKRLAPADAGVERIGHFGFFNARVGPALWEAHLLPELA